MEKSIIQRLIDAGVITKKDIDEYNNQNLNSFNRRDYCQRESHMTYSVIKHNDILVRFNPEDIVNGKYVVPVNIRYIGENAFKDCKYLTEIDFSMSSVEEIGAEAFAYCSNLRKVKFGPDLKVVEKCAFWKCEQLECVNLDVKNTKIHWTAFMHCPNWEQVSKILWAKREAGEEIDWHH